MAATLKQWNGSAWVAKPMKFWSGSAWVQKPVKFWNGSAWVGPAGGVVAPTFLALGNLSYASRAVADIPKPAGTALNTIVLVGLFAGSGASPANPTPASGFTPIGAYSTPNDGGFFGRFSVWWKRATGSEPGTYDFTRNGTYNSQGFALAYNGCPTAGDPVDVFSQNTGTSLTATGTGVTTTQANDMLAWLGHNWDGSGALAPPAEGGGMTERFDSLGYAADQVIVAAGATGNRTQTQAAANPWSAFLVALKGI